MIEYSKGLIFQKVSNPISLILCKYHSKKNLILGQVDS